MAKANLRNVSSLSNKSNQFLQIKIAFSLIEIIIIMRTSNLLKQLLFTLLINRVGLIT